MRAASSRSRQGDPRTRGHENWTKKCRTTGRTGDGCKLRRKKDEDGDVWSVAYDLLGVKRLKVK